MMIQMYAGCAVRGMCCSVCGCSVCGCSVCCDADAAVAVAV
eukprot:COSAG01_NODE_67878_length_265_cov_2.174699_1_plen_40_part_01